MIVDCHAHLVPPDLLAAIRKDAARFPSVRQIEDGGSVAFAFGGGKPTRPVSKPLSDIPARLAWMAKQGIDKQVVGGWVDMFGYELPGAEAEAWDRLTNEALACGGQVGARISCRSRPCRWATVRARPVCSKQLWPQDFPAR